MQTCFFLANVAAWICFPQVQIPQRPVYVPAPVYQPAPIYVPPLQPIPTLPPIGGSDAEGN